MMPPCIDVRREGLLAVLLVTAACSRPDPTCNTPPQGLTVRYVGQAYGYGTIGVDWNEKTQQHHVSAQMMGPDSSTKIRLEGEGECTEGILRARLAGGRDETTGLQVLGGGLVVLFDHHPMPTATGWWDVRVVDADADAGRPDGRRVRGMLEAVDPEDVPRPPRPNDDAPGRDVDGGPDALTPNADDAPQ